MTRGKKLTGMVAAFALLCGAAYAATQYDFEKETTPEQEDVTVYSQEAEKVTMLSWVRGEEEAVFEKKDGEWKNTADENFPVDESYLSTMLEDLTELKSDKVIENPDALADYGLETGECVIRITDEGGTDELVIGDATSIDGKRYLSNGDGKVYLVESSLLDDFSYTANDLLKTESLPTISSVQVIELDKGSETFLMTKKEEADGTEIWTTDRNGEEKKLDSSQVISLINNVAGMSMGTCAEYYADDAKMQEYGFGEGEWKISFTYLAEVSAEDETEDTADSAESQCFTFVLSKDGGYMHLLDSVMIYEMDTTVSDALYQATYENLMNKEVMSVDWEGVSSLDIVLDGETYHVEKQEKTVETEVEGEDGTETVTEVTAVFLLDEKEVDLQGIQDACTALAAVEDASGMTPEKKEEVHFTIHCDSLEEPEIEMVFYQYDGENCLTVKNGSATVLVSRSDVIAVKEAVNAIVLQ